MNKTTKSFLALLITFLLFYLVGCFVEVTFNLSNWDKDTRALIATFGALFSAVGFGFTYDNSK